MTPADVILTVAATYAAAGVLFGLAFVTAGAPRLDPAARGSSVAFRLLILPGATALWPLLAVRWIRLGGSE